MVFIYAQQINLNGDVQFITDGVGICASKEVQSFPQIINDGTGGIIIAWQDRRSGLDYDIYVQMIRL